MDLERIFYLAPRPFLLNIPSAVQFLPTTGIRLLNRHGCSEQGGSYVNYPIFVASFAAAVRDAEHASVVAAVAAADAAAATTDASAGSGSRAAPAAKSSSGMVSGVMPAAYNKRSREPVR